MSPVTIKTIDTSSVKLDVSHAYNVDKAIWRDFNLNDGKSPTDRQNRVTMANYALQVNVPTLVKDEYDISLIGTGVSTRDLMFSREILGVRSNQLTRTLQPKSVTRVILLSLHFLHAGNLISYNNRGDAEPICPNAEYVVPREEWEAAMSNDPYLTLAYRDVRHDLKMLQELDARIRLVDDEEIEVSQNMTLIRSGGVTPANSTIIISCGSEKIMASPLLFATPYHMNPGVQFGFSMNQYQAFKEKNRLLEKAEREGLCLFFPMDPQRRVAYINRDKSGRFVGTPCDILSQIDPLIR